MVYHIEKSEAEMIKIIDVDSDVTSVNYGPFDNGHIMIGLENGFLMIYEYPNLERIESVKIFQNEGISTINFDPTNYIFLSGSQGSL